MGPSAAAIVEHVLDPLSPGGVVPPGLYCVWDANPVPFRVMRSAERVSLDGTVSSLIAVSPAQPSYCVSQYLGYQTKSTLLDLPVGAPDNRKCRREKT